MTNLLPQEPQKKLRSELRARFLLAGSLVLLCCAAMFALALVPAEVSIAFFSPPQAQAAQAGINVAQDGAAIAHTKAELAQLQPVASSTSLTALSAALADQPQGLTIDDLSYSISENMLTITGHATPDQVNAFREALQDDATFSNVSVPVSALIGAQGGGFTITMKVNQ